MKFSILKDASKCSWRPISTTRFDDIEINIPFDSFLRFVPESPRLLLSKGREEEAITVLEKMSKMNKRPLPDDLVLQRPVIPEKRISFLQLFRSCKIAKLTLISWDLW